MQLFLTQIFILSCPNQVFLPAIPETFTHLCTSVTARIHLNANRKATGDELYLTEASWVKLLLAQRFEPAACQLRCHFLPMPQALRLPSWWHISLERQPLALSGRKATNQGSAQVVYIQRRWVSPCITIWLVFPGMTNKPLPQCFAKMDLAEKRVVS